MTHTDGLKDVETLINRFGGMRPMARKIDVPVSTIQGWKKRDFIPAERVNEILKAAKAHRVSLHGYDIPTASNENTNTTTHNQAKTEDSALSSSPLRPERTQEKPSKRECCHGDNHSNIAHIKRAAVTRSVMTTLVLLVLFGGLGYIMFGEDAKEIKNITSNQQEMDRRLDKFRSDYESFETTVSDGLNNLNNRVTEVASAVGIERDSQGNVILNNNMTMSERLTALESRMRASGEDIDLGQLASRFENLTQAVQGQGDTDAAMEDMKAIIDGIQSRMGELDAALAEAKAENAEMARSLENVTGRDVSAAAMLLAMTQMRESLNRSEPFAEDLQILQNLVGDEDPELTAAINRLAPYAESGVLTPQGLSAELRGLTGEIIAAAMRGEDVSVKEKMAARLGQILSVEKNGQPIMGVKEQAIIAKAQAALDRGDVAAAVTELDKLEGEAAQAASPVTQQALGTLNAQKTIGLLMDNMVKKMQNPEQIRGMMQSIPQEIKNQVNPNKPIFMTE